MGRECTTLYYTVYSNRNFENMKLSVGDLLAKQHSTIALNCLPSAKYDALFQDFVIKINLKSCLLGFIFESDGGTCLCSPKINAHSGVFCDFDNYQIAKTKQLWLSAPNEHTGEDYRVIIHDFCPYDHCKQQ